MDKIEAVQELVQEYYMTIDADNDELVSTLEELQNKINNDSELMLVLDKHICELNTLRQVSTDIQETNMLNLSTQMSELISDLLSMYIDGSSSDISKAELIDVQMIRDHIGRDCTLVVTKQRN